MRPVPELLGIDMVFGSIKHLPPMSKIPEKFKNMNHCTPQNRMISKWFFQGLTKEDTAKLIPKEGVDKSKALAAIAAVLRSFDPKHEHKEAGAAFLLSEWFEEPKL